MVNLENIESIDLGHNKITKIAKDYAKLADTLTRLNLSYNMIQDIAPITEPGSTVLRSLYLAHNLIQTVPKNINTLTVLEYLDLSKNLLRDEAATYVGTLANSLIYLNLAHNLIGNIPSTFGDFVKSNILILLDMSYNQLREIKYITDIQSLLFLNLSNNQLRDMIPLSNLIKLQVLDLGFNQLSDIDKIVGELLYTKKTLTNFSIRHQRSAPRTMGRLAGAIPDKIKDLTKLYNGGSQIDYNRLESYKVIDPTLLTFLNEKFVNTSNAADYLNTDRMDQYQIMNVKLTSTLDTATPIYQGDTIQVTLHYKNE